MDFKAPGEQQDFEKRLDIAIKDLGKLRKSELNKVLTFEQVEVERGHYWIEIADASDTKAKEIEKKLGLSSFSLSRYAKAKK